MRFFEPTRRFLEWAITALRGRAVFDVGAGEGHVTRMLVQRGLSVFALDLFAQVDPTVLQTNGVLFVYPKGSIVMLCRPCHGAFPSAVVQQAVKCQAAQVLYCGLDQNAPRDLGNYYGNFVRVLAGAGTDSESVWRWTLQDARDLDEVANEDADTAESTTMRVALVQWEPFAKPYWVMDQGAHWGHRSGGYMPKCGTDQVLATAVVPVGHWRDLDWRETGFYNPTADAGWLSPSGEFFGCGWEEHDVVADLIIKRSVADLEDQGWVRVDRAGAPKEQTYRCMRALTAAQRAWLAQRGHDLAFDCAPVIDPDQERLAAMRALAAVPPRRRR